MLDVGHGIKTKTEFVVPVSHVPSSMSTLEGETGPQFPFGVGVRGTHRVRSVVMIPQGIPTQGSLAVLGGTCSGHSRGFQMLLLSPNPGPLGKRQRREQPGCYTLNGLGVNSTPAVTASTPQGRCCVHSHLVLNPAWVHLRCVSGSSELSGKLSPKWVWRSLVFADPSS